MENLIFPNGVKHLRAFLRAGVKSKTEENEALSEESEGELSAVHMCFMCPHGGRAPVGCRFDAAQENFVPE